MFAVTTTTSTKTTRFEFIMDESVGVPLVHNNNNTSETTRSVLKTMKRLERTTYKRPRAKDLAVQGLWRKQIVEWMYILVKHCKLKHEATAAAVYYLDCAASIEGFIEDPRDYQLSAMTALHLALKVYDSPSVRVVPLKALVKLGNGDFTQEDIVQHERMLLDLLSWRIHPPTPNCFLHQFLGFVHNNNNKQRLEEIACDYIEIAMARDFFSSVPSSVIAYAALLSAMEVTTQEDPNHNNYDWIAFVQQMAVDGEMGDMIPNLPLKVLKTKECLEKIAQGLPLPIGEGDDDEDSHEAYTTESSDSILCTRDLSSSTTQRTTPTDDSDCSEFVAPSMRASPSSPTSTL